MSPVVMLLGFVDLDAATPPDVPLHRRVPFRGGLDAILIDDAAVEGAPEVKAMELALAQVSILSAYAASDDVLPVSLGAAFSGDGALLAHLDAAVPLLLAQRAVIAGQSEWIVAIDRQRPDEARPRIEGAGYLRRRQAEISARRDTETARGAFVTSVIQAFGTGDVRLDGPQARSRESLAVVAALVQRAAAEGVRRRLEVLAAEGESLGLALRLIGPCAPFSFIAAVGCDG
jgi:hypothetical protein